MNKQERFDRLDRFIEEDRIVRHTWGDGQELACLLLAIAPEVSYEDDNGQTYSSPMRCPADVLPKWMAKLTPYIDDCGSDTAWPKTIRRYARTVRAASMTFSEEQWAKVELAVQLAFLHKYGHRLEGLTSTVENACRAWAAGEEAFPDAVYPCGSDVTEHVYAPGLLQVLDGPREWDDFTDMLLSTIERELGVRACG